MDNEYVLYFQDFLQQNSKILPPLTHMPLIFYSHASMTYPSPTLYNHIYNKVKRQAMTDDGIHTAEYNIKKSNTSFRRQYYKTIVVS